MLQLLIACATNPQVALLNEMKGETHGIGICKTAG